MEKRYQVFVSSTYEDLRDERVEVMQALLELDCMPSGMELFPAASDDQWTLIQRVIDDCDYYLVIIGGRYGSIGTDGRSYTQMEYEYAVSKAKPVIAFLHSNPGSIPANKTESSEEGKKKLREFCELAKKKVVKTWSSPKELGSVVSRSIVKLIRSNPAVGWVKADTLVETLAGPELLRLRKRVEELQKQIARVQDEAPAGAEKLAQGDEKFQLIFSVDYETADGEEYNWDAPVDLSWENIFKVASHVLTGMADEDEIAEALVKFCADEVRKQLGDDGEVGTVELSPESLRTVLVQLRGLGLIEQNGSGITPRWTLTHYGDKTVSRLYAITKGEASKPMRKPEKAARRI